MKLIIILALCFTLTACNTTASGTNHSANIMTNILSLEF